MKRVQLGDMVSDCKQKKWEYRGQSMPTWQDGTTDSKMPVSLTYRYGGPTVNTLGGRELKVRSGASVPECDNQTAT